MGDLSSNGFDEEVAGKLNRATRVRRWERGLRESGKPKSSKVLGCVRDRLGVEGDTCQGKGS